VYKHKFKTAGDFEVTFIDKNKELESAKLYLTVEPGKKDAIDIINKSWKNTRNWELGNPIPDFKIRLLDSFQNLVPWTKEDLSSLQIEAKLIDNGEDVAAGL
jgi:hypothetical protein